MGQIEGWLAARLRALLIVGCVALAVAWAAPAAFAVNRIYWANFPTNTISFANLNGTGGFGNVNTGAGIINGPSSVAIDPAAGRIYWGNDSGNSISFANLSGGGGGQINTAGATVKRPFGIAVDRATGKVYWANAGATSPPGISFANLNGSGGGNLNTGHATVNQPTGVAIDPAAGRIYWANFSANKISFAYLDNVSGGGDLATVGATVSTPEGVAIDHATNRIYWANHNGGKISFANLNGVGGGNVPTGAATVSFPSGVAIDPASGTIYWANQGGGQISFARLNGSGGGNLNTGGSTSTNAKGPALLEAPAGAGAPRVTGSVTAPSQLGCASGIWGPDLLEALLYRAPQSFAFTWFKNGAQISGATGGLLTASTPGSYSCRVTAQNFAGSSSQTSAAFVVAPPPTVSATGSTSGSMASVRITCHGVVGQTCSGRATLRASVKAGSVTGDKRRRKHKPTQVTVGSGSYSVVAGGTTTVQIPLNSRGRRLLDQFLKLRTKVNFPGTGSQSTTVTFRLVRIEVRTASLLWAASLSGSTLRWTTAYRLILNPVPVGASVRIGCRGGGCPFTLKSVTARQRSVPVTGMFGDRHLLPGTKVTFAITAPGRVGEQLTYSLTRLNPPAAIRCFPPGSRRTVRC